MAVETQIVREAPEIEAYKLGLLKQAQDLYGKPMNLPAVQAAGLAPGQEQAATLARQGIGSWQPYVAAGAQGIGAGQQLTGTAANVLGNISTAPTFAQSQQALQTGMGLAAQLPAYAQAAGQGLPQIATGTQTLNQAAQRAGQVMPEFGQAQSTIAGGLTTGQQAVQAAQMAAQQPGFGQAQTALQQGIGALGGAAQGYNPQGAQAFMNPYQEQVTQRALQEMRRQGEIAAQQTAAQAVRSGAFGGTREGVQRAEQERNLQDLMSQRAFQDYAQNYAQAQQAAQTSFEAQQQRQLAQAQGFQGAAGAAGQLAATQAGLGQQAAQLQAQQAGLGVQAGSQLGALESQRAQLGLEGAGLMGQMGAQQAQLGLLPAQLAAQQAAITGQGANLLGSLGEGIGTLGLQQGGLDLQRGSAMGQLGTGLGQLGVQQAALGQAAQQLTSGDVGLLSGIGAIEQQAAQAKLDAARATQLQETMAPYQQLGFVSDIYKGAPSSQMSLTSATAPTASPLQSAIGTVVGGVSTAAAAQRSGLF